MQGTFSQIQEIRIDLEQVTTAAANLMRYALYKYHSKGKL
jgi:hypothetical protein